MDQKTWYDGVTVIHSSMLQFGFSWAHCRCCWRWRQEIAFTADYVGVYAKVDAALYVEKYCLGCHCSGWWWLRLLHLFSQDKQWVTISTLLWNLWPEGDTPLAWNLSFHHSYTTFDTFSQQLHMNNTQNTPFLISTFPWQSHNDSSFIKMWWICCFSHYVAIHAFLIYDFYAAFYIFRAPSIVLFLGKLIVIDYGWT